MYVRFSHNLALHMMIQYTKKDKHISKPTKVGEDENFRTEPSVTSLSTSRTDGERS